MQIFLVDVFAIFEVLLIRMLKNFNERKWADFCIWKIDCDIAMVLAVSPDMSIFRFIFWSMMFLFCIFVPICS